MSKQNSLKIQTCILKVNIDCKGCAMKVTKLLQKIKGVYSVRIDAEEQGKVIVAGNVDPAMLIKKLKKSGKHAELLGDNVDVQQQQQRGGMNMYNPQNYPINNNHFLQNFQVNKGTNDKSQNQKGQKGGGEGHIVAHFQNMEGPQNLKVPQNKQHKAVTFKNLPDDEFDSIDHYHGQSYDDSDEEEEEGYGHGHPIPMDYNNNNNNYKVMPMMRNGPGPRRPAGQMTGPVIVNNHKGNGGGDGNHGSVIEKKNGKSNGGVVGRLKSFGKNKKKGAAVVSYNGNSKNKHDFDFHDYDDDMPSYHGKNGKSGKNGDCKNSKGGVNGNMGQIGLMGNNNNGGGGYQQHQGVQMQQAPPYNIEQQQQQQQYMEMMMNQRKQQQHMMMNQREQQQQQQQQANMYPQPAPAMMYDGQQPNNSYMPPPPMPSHPRADPITHTLSDENPNACTIM